VVSASKAKLAIEVSQATKQITEAVASSLFVGKSGYAVGQGELQGKAGIGESGMFRVAP